jgi:hypothetical protein
MNSSVLSDDENHNRHNDKISNSSICMHRYVLAYIHTYVHICIYIHTLHLSAMTEFAIDRAKQRSNRCTHMHTYMHALTIYH